MSRTLKATLVILSLLYCGAGSVVAQPSEGGFKAFEGGNYPTAMRLLRPLAAEGDARAQYNVGVMYEEGLGVPIDYTEAVGWLLQAAEQGNSEAKNHLGFLYLYGRAFPRTTSALTCGSTWPPPKGTCALFSRGTWSPPK
jgi:TPR repeat protein